MSAVRRADEQEQQQRRAGHERRSRRSGRARGSRSARRGSRTWRYRRRRGPVTHTAEVAVNRASSEVAGVPVAVANGSARRIVPITIRTREPEEQDDRGRRWAPDARRPANLVVLRLHELDADPAVADPATRTPTGRSGEPCRFATPRVYRQAPGARRGRRDRCGNRQRSVGCRSPKWMPCGLGCIRALRRRLAGRQAYLGERVAVFGVRDLADRTG